jgi:hypothetical protein
VTVIVSQGHQGHLPEDMPTEQMTLEWFARTYHFTDQETENLSLDALEWWPVIALARIQAQHLEQAREARMQRNSGR